MVERELFRAGALTVHVYHLLALLAVGAGLAVIYQMGRRRGLRLPGLVDAVGFVALCAASTKLLGSLIQIVHFRGSLASYYLFHDEGMTILGGIAASLVVGRVYCRLRGIPFYAAAIPCAFGLTVFTLVQRVVCFLNGCCFGVPTDSIFGHVFPPTTEAGAVFPGQPLHPTQLYTVAAYLGILAFLIHYAPQVEERLLFGVFLMYVAGERLLNQAFRWADNNDVLFLAGGQVITGHTLIAALLLLYGLAEAVAALRSPQRDLAAVASPSPRQPA